MLLRDPGGGWELEGVGVVTGSELLPAPHELSSAPALIVPKARRNSRRDCMAHSSPITAPQRELGCGNSDLSSLVEVLARPAKTQAQLPDRDALDTEPAEALVMEKRQSRTEQSIRWSSCSSGYPGGTQEGVF
jgi:hypothetical protein